MTDRDVQVIISLKASMIDTSRKFAVALGEFPTVAWNYADQLETLLSNVNVSSEDKVKLAELVEGLKRDAELAEVVRRDLAPILHGAIISDPEGRKGPLQ